MGEDLRVLSLSDREASVVYSPQICRYFKEVDLIIGCGDLAYHYLEFALSMLNVPLFFVRGNHDKVVEYSPEGHQRVAPHGGVDLHRRVEKYKGRLLAGVDGSLRYRAGPFQYSQPEMWNHVFSLVPRLMANRLLYGRYLDIFIAHSPPAGIHDEEDLPHQGIKAFRWLVKVFHPAYFFHGHIHVYRPDTVIDSFVGTTRVINTYGYRDIKLTF